jgi:hypothetical protein
MANNVQGSPASGSNMVIGSREYPINAVILTADGTCVPVVDIPQMSDEKWHERECKTG